MHPGNFELVIAAIKKVCIQNGMLLQHTFLAALPFFLAWLFGRKPLPIWSSGIQTPMACMHASNQTCPDRPPSQRSQSPERNSCDVGSNLLSPVHAIFLLCRNARISTLTLVGSPESGVRAKRLARLQKNPKKLIGLAVMGSWPRQGPSQCALSRAATFGNGSSAAP